jgi:hypothetical protein
MRSRTFDANQHAYHRRAIPLPTSAVIAPITAALTRVRSNHFVAHGSLITVLI